MIHGKIHKAFFEEQALEIREDEPMESQGKGTAEKAGRSAQAWGKGGRGCSHSLQEPLQEGVKEPLSESSTAESVIIQQRSWLSPGGLLPTSTAQRYSVEETLRTAAAQGQTCTVISQLCLNRK